RSGSTAARRREEVSCEASHEEANPEEAGAAPTRLAPRRAATRNSIDSASSAASAGGGRRRKASSGSAATAAVRQAGQPSRCRSASSQPGGSAGEASRATARRRQL